MAAVACRYQVLRLGLCFFVAGASEVYVAHSFEVYLFPEDRPGSASDVSLDLRAVEAHKDKKFDFNKWIYEGVPYLSDRQKELLHSRMHEEHCKEDEDVLSLTGEETKRIDSALSSIKGWWQSGAKGEYVIHNFNPYLRKYMYQTIGKFYPGLNIECKSNGKFNKDLILTMLTAKTQKSIKDAKTKKQLSVIQRKSGAHRIFKLLAKAKPIIVGHKLLLTLMFLYNTFQQELPSTLSDFKERLHSLFPTIYDTMTMLAKDQSLPSCLGLEAVRSLLAKEPKTKVVVAGGGKETDCGSYVIGRVWLQLGCCFAKLLERLKQVVRFKNILYCDNAPFNVNVMGEEELDEDKIVLVGSIFNAKTAESIKTMLKNYKDICCMEYTSDKIKSLFITIKKQQ